MAVFLDCLAHVVDKISKPQTFKAMEVSCLAYTLVVSHPSILKMLVRRAGIYIYYLSYC